MSSHDNFEATIKKKHYDVHRNRVKQAKAKIDTANPSVSTNHYFTTMKNKVCDDMKHDTLLRQNRSLAERIAKVFCSRGSLDNWMTDYHKKSVARDPRLIETVRITNDNLDLLKRLQTTHSHYPRHPHLSCPLQVPPEAKDIRFQSLNLGSAQACPHPGIRLPPIGEHNRNYNANKSHKLLFKMPDDSTVADSNKSVAANNRFPKSSKRL